MRIAVCDDEKEIVDQVCHIVSSLGYMVDGYSNPESLNGKQYDVYFLDIDMGKRNGIDVGHAIRKQDMDVHIIYLTNFDEYRSMAFGVHAFDYLKKPVNQDDIKRVMSELAQMKQKKAPMLLWKSKDGILQIKADDIYYFEFYDRRVLLHAVSGTYQLSQNMHTIAEQMKPYHFSMPHKSFCINLLHIRLVKGYDITMVNGERLPLSQKRSSEFRKELNDFLCERISGGDGHE